MTTYHLRKSELEYELKIRAQPTEGSAGELRKRLTACLAANTPIDKSVLNNLDPRTELEQTEETFADLSSLVKDYDGNYKDNEYNRISARIWHLYLRVQNIPTAASLDEELEQRKDDLETKTKALVDSFVPQSVAVQENPADPAEKTLTSTMQSSNTQKEGFELPNLPSKVDTPAQNLIKDTTRPMVRQVDLSSEHVVNTQSKGLVPAEPLHSYRQKSVPVYKWGLKFDSQSSLSISSFLERVEELRRARGVTREELFESAVDLFTGPALVWYRSTLNRIKSWEELCQEMKVVFQSPDYDFRLRHEIFTRMQGEFEPIDMFMAAMDGLYGRLSESVSESTRLSQIYNNLHPHLQDRLALVEIKTLEELRLMGRRAEVGRLRAVTPRSVSRNGNALEPDLANPDSYKRRGQPSFGRVAAVETGPSSRPYSHRSVECWNCGGSGHRYAVCKKERRTFCFGCGKPDTIKSKCPKCSSKNGSGWEPAL